MTIGGDALARMSLVIILRFTNEFFGLSVSLGILWS